MCLVGQIYETLSDLKFVMMNRLSTPPPLTHPHVTHLYTPPTPAHSPPLGRPPARFDACLVRTSRTRAHLLCRTAEVSSPCLDLKLMASTWGGAGGRDAVTKPCALAAPLAMEKWDQTWGKRCNMMLYMAMWRMWANMMKHEKIDSKHLV